MDIRHKGTWLGLLVGLLAGLTIGSSLADPTTDRIERMKNDFLRPMVWLLDKVDTVYVEDVDFAELLEGATHGVMSKLDPYSVYMPPARNRAFDEEIKGEFGGLGIQITFMPIEKVVRVEQPIPGTPAFRLGIMAGDLIVRVREDSTGKVVTTDEFEDVHDAVAVLRGKAGSKVTITVVHGERGSMEEFTITRAVIKIPGVRGAEVLDQQNSVGYVYVPHFQERVVDDLKKALDELKEKDIKGVVIDLRFNPGGLLDQATAMADLFLDKDQVIVSTRNRVGYEEIHRAKTAQAYPGLAIALLVNRASASASEIVAAALQDNDRAVVVGEPTFGKASVQKKFRHLDGKSAIKLTVARYYTPKGKLIQKSRDSKDKGVPPNVELLLSMEDQRKLARQIAERADFVKPKNKEPEEEPAAGEDHPGTEQPGTEQPPAEGPAKEKEEPFKDAQLELAVAELIKVMAGQPIPQPGSKATVKAEEPQPVGVED